jgi:hypothetical protein
MLRKATPPAGTLNGLVSDRLIAGIHEVVIAESMLQHDAVQRLNAHVALDFVLNHVDVPNPKSLPCQCVSS